MIQGAAYGNFSVQNIPVDPKTLLYDTLSTSYGDKVVLYGSSLSPVRTVYTY